MELTVTNQTMDQFFLADALVEVVDDHRGGKIVVNLTGRLNKCGVISPRFDIAIPDIEKWTNNLLPSRQFG